MTLYAFKPAFVRWVRPTAGRLARLGVTANEVTVASTGLSLAIGFGVAANADTREVFLLIPVWFPLRMVLNAIDGLLAREFYQRTPLGAYLNELGDVVSDAALYLPFALVKPFSALSVGTIIFFALLAEFAGALGATVGSERRYDGPMGKSDRALVFGALGLWVGVGLPASVWMSWLMPALALLLVRTIVNRARAGIRFARTLRTDVHAHESWTRNSHENGA